MGIMRPGDPEISQPKPPPVIKRPPPRYTQPISSAPAARVPRTSAPAYSNPDLIGGMPSRTVYRPRVTPPAPTPRYDVPHYYKPVAPTNSPNPLVKQTATQEALHKLIAGGASDYEISLALDAAIKQRYNFIVNTQKHQANQATHHLIRQYNEATDELYHPPDWWTQLTRNIQGKPAIMKPPKLKLYKREAFQPILPGTAGTIKKFNRMTTGMDPTQKSYMGSTFSSMLYASQQEHGAINFDKSRLHEVRQNYIDNVLKNKAFHEQHDSTSSDSNGVTAPPNPDNKPLFGDQVKDDSHGISLDSIGGWLGGAADKVGGAASDVAGAGADAFNAVPGSSHLEDGVGNVWNSDLVKSTRHIAGESGGAALSWTIDKLSRPLYAVASGYDQFLSVGETRGRGVNGHDILHDLTHPISMYRDIIGAPFDANGQDVVRQNIEHPGNILKSFAKAGEGFSNGGFTGNAKNPTTFGKVIANQAVRDKKQNIYDDPSYQIFGGLVGDLAGDPLNYLGIGLASKPVLAAKTFKDGKDLTETSTKVSEYLKENGVTHLDPKQVEELITGGYKKLPKSAVDRANMVDRGLHGSHYLNSQLDLAARSGADTSKLDSITNKLAEVHARHEKLVKDYGLDALHHHARENIAKAVRAGKLPEQRLQEFDELLNTNYLQGQMQRMIDARKAFIDHEAKGTGEPFTGERAHDLLPDALKSSFTPKEIDHFIGRTYKLMMGGQAHEAGNTFRRLAKPKTGSIAYMHRSINALERSKAGAGSADDLALLDTRIGRLRSSVDAMHSTKYRSQASVFLQVMKDELARRAGQDVFREPERAAELQGMIHKAERALDNPSEASLEHFPEHELGEVDYGSADPHELLSGAVDKWQRELDYLNTLHGNKIQGISPIETQNFDPEFMHPDVLKDLIRTHKGYYSYDSSKVTPEESAFLDKLISKADEERELRYGGYLDKLRKGKSADLKQLLVNKGTEAENAARSKIYEPFADRVVPNGNGFTEFVEHNGGKVLKGSKEADKLVTPKIKKYSESMHYILDRIRYPNGSNTDAIGSAEDFAKLRRIAKIHGHTIPEHVGDNLHDWRKYLRGSGNKNTMYRNFKDWTEAKHVAFDTTFKKTHGEYPWETRTKIQNAVKGKEPEFDKEQVIKSAEKEAERKHARSDYNTTRQMHAEDALNHVLKELQAGRLSTDRFYNSLSSHELPDYAGIRKAMDEKHAAERQEVKLNEDDLADPKVRKNANARRRRLEQKMTALKEQQNIERQALEQAKSTAKDSAETYKKAILEEVRLRAVQSETTKQYGLKLHFIGGSSTFIPAPMSLTRSGDVLGGLPLIKHTRQVYANLFKQPTAGMPDMMVYARNKRTAQTADIIHSAIKVLNNKFKDMKPEARVNALNAFATGGRNSSPEAAVVADAFDELLPYFQRKVQVGDQPITISKINSFLDEPYRIANRSNDISDSRDLVASLKGNKMGKNGDLHPKVKDPYDVLWNLHIGVAQAEANMAVRKVLLQFGVKREGKVVNDKFIPRHTDLGKAVERLGNKDTGWKTIPELGNSHYFPADIVVPIQRLLDSFEPRNLHKMSEYFDQATRAWKATATIYNPGFWTRNGIGEMSATWFAGHQNPKDYIRSGSLIKYMTGEGEDLEALKSHFPIEQPLVGDEGIKGNRVSFTMRSGQKVTYEELTRHFNDQGLNTGYFNDEFERNKVADRLLHTPVVKHAVAGHRQMRDWGENYENFLRAAHFIAVIRKSNKPLAEAALDAAQEVRKYHFDYTDFTKFEKMVMLRSFPFYKWTRRAMPLFFGMMFTKPGKTMAYPKVANAASNLLTNTDVDQDPNGFIPTYHGIVPSWIQDMMAYQISGSTDTGLGDYLNVNVPQMDSLKSLMGPSSTGYAMFNPLLKAPIEQVAGHTLGDKFGSYSVDFHDKKKGNLNRINALLDLIPAGKFAARAGVKGNRLDRGEITSFLTGAGDYENTPARQYGEMLSRMKK